MLRIPLRSKIFLWNENSKDYWNERYSSGGNSGNGSYGELALYKAEFINRFIEANQILSVVEFGCGDGNQLNLINCHKYRGYDISKTIIQNCKKQFEKDVTKEFFILSDFEPMTFDLAISLDVIFHLIEDENFENHMKLLFDSSKRFVLIYSSNVEKMNLFLKPHIRHRRFTDWIYKNAPDWKLILYTPNKFKKSTRHHSFSDFYVFEKVNGK